VIYEDFVVGASHPLGAHRFTVEEIRRFALAYDPQPFHIDEDAAKASLFGGLCASGWHTASVMMGLLSRTFARFDEQARSAGRPSAALGPSPGFDDLKWLRAVYPGDTITFASEVVGKRPSASRPGWGLVTIKATGVNQDGQRVFAVTAHVFAVVTRPDAGPE